MTNQVWLYWSHSSSRLLLGQGYLECKKCVQVKRDGKIFTNPDEGSNGASSAPDGDLDSAYALLLAGTKWSNKIYTQRGIQVQGLCNISTAT